MTLSDSVIVFLATSTIIFVLWAPVLVMFMEPWKAVLGGLTIGLAAGIVVLNQTDSLLSGEIDPDDYAYVDQTIAKHPGLVPIAKTMLSDGIVTGSEFDSFRREARRLDDAATKEQALTSIEDQVRSTEMDPTPRRAQTNPMEN